MARIDINFQNLDSKEVQALDIYQFQIISLYERLLNEENVIEYLGALSSNGYVLAIEFKDDKFRFYGCDDAQLQRIKEWGRKADIQNEFYYGVIFFCKKLLRDWHKNRSVEAKDLKYSWRPGKTVYTRLNHKQRGTLTKILKMYYKRKKMQVQLFGV